MTNPIDVTVLGATGVVGQRFVRRLQNHPWFRIACLAASDKSEGKRYRDACAWRLDGEPYGGLGDVVLTASSPDVAAAPFVFSALDTGPAAEIEPRFAKRGCLVFSNAATFRMEADVPLLVPEVNPEHLGLLETQRVHRGFGEGGIVTNPNCTSTVLVLALAPLQRAFGVEAVHVTSMQAVSGAGYPGVPSLDVLGNVIPYIAKEETKVEAEIPKMLGRFEGDRVTPLDCVVSAMCHRVPVLDGHSEAVSIRLRGSPSPADVRDALASFVARPQDLELPSAPQRPILVYAEESRPQVRLDVEKDGGMPVHVGRVRACPLFGIKLFVLGHNTERGAAGASILNAELFHATGIPGGLR